MELVAAGLTDAGMQRGYNEDRFHLDPDLGLLVVCDGMGGHASGALAAQTAIDVIAEVVADHRTLLDNISSGRAAPGAAGGLSDPARPPAAAAVLDMATSRAEAAGMGCTATAILLRGWHAALGHVGDSRLYVSREGQCHRLSSDHTMGRDMVARGMLAPEDLADHPFASALTRAIGVQRSVQVETLQFDLRGDDRLLLCSDGLHAYIDSHAWLAGELDDDDVGRVVEGLVNHANDRGGHDNISAVVVRIGVEPPELPLPMVDSQTGARLEALEQVHLFRGLGLARLYHVLSATRFVAIPAGEVFVDVGDDLSSLYVVARGAIRASLAKGGSVRLGPGDHFGSTTLLRPRPSRARIEATVDSTVIQIGRARFQQMVRAKPYLGLLLYERLGRHVCGELDREGAALLDIRKAVLKVGPEASVTL